jgi:hypothetical protein
MSIVRVIDGMNNLQHHRHRQQRTIEVVMVMINGWIMNHSIMMPLPHGLVHLDQGLIVAVIIQS